MLRRQKMGDDVEALLAGRIIDGGEIDEAHEETARIVAQIGHGLDEAGRLDRQGQFVVGRRNPRRWRRAEPPLSPRRVVSGRCPSRLFRSASEDDSKTVAVPHVRPRTSIRFARPERFTARSCRCGGSSFGEAKCRREALPPRAGSRERRYRRARSGRSRARPNRNNGNSRRHWRRSPWR